MPSWHRSSLIVLVLLLLNSQTISAQNESHKSAQPKIVLDLQKPVSGDKLFPAPRFGMTCHLSGSASSQYRNLDHPASISELLGAPVELVRIRNYGPRWKKSDDVRKHIITVLETQTDAVYQYEAWAEFVRTDIIATIRFSDKSEGALEESGGHVCFVDHSKIPVWARISSRN